MQSNEAISKLSEKYPMYCVDITFLVILCESRLCSTCRRDLIQASNFSITYIVDHDN